jgi:alkylresorcinol/alkylpyrone synthase
MTYAILGLGTAVPSHTMSQEESAALAREVICRTDQQARVLTGLYQKAGVKNRYTVLPHQTALDYMPDRADISPGLATEVVLGPTTAERMQFFAQHAAPLAHQAAALALDESGIDRRRITHLVTVCCTGFAAPGVDVELIDALQLRSTTQRIQVGFMGCHGAINGLRVAQALTTADAGARVLFCAVELCSLHYRFNWDPPRMVANALFSDGAAAVVGSGERPNDSQTWTVAATGSCLLPDSKDAMTWRIGDHGFEMTLAANVPDLIRQHLRSWLAGWLDEHGHSIASVGSWAIHPGGPRILHACGEALGLAREQLAGSEEVLAQFGNMSSPTVLFILDRLRKRKAPLPCVSLAFGPGLAAEAVLFE